MNKVLVSHECPIGLLDTVQKWNDYDYALVHLFDTHRQYYKFMRRCVKEGRHVILDNSIFELGEAFDWNRYKYWINKLQPSEYIIPDKLENCDGTMSQCEKWLESFSDSVCKRSKIIGVIQGKTYEELVKCYNYMVKHVDKIAISFDFSFYENIAIGNKWEKFARGRSRLLKMLHEDGILNHRIPLHLLGCALPQEFKYYSYCPYNIQTIDTSNPVQQAILGQKYSGVEGLKTKKTDKVADSFDRRRFTKDELILIEYNCEQLRKIISND